MAAVGWSSPRLGKVAPGVPRGPETRHEREQQKSRLAPTWRAFSSPRRAEPSSVAPAGSSRHESGCATRRSRPELAVAARMRSGQRSPGVGRRCLRALVVVKARAGRSGVEGGCYRDAPRTRATASARLGEAVFVSICLMCHLTVASLTKSRFATCALVKPQLPSEDLELTGGEWRVRCRLWLGCGAECQFLKLDRSALEVGGRGLKCFLSRGSVAVKTARSRGGPHRWGECLDEPRVPVGRVCAVAAISSKSVRVPRFGCTSQ